MKPRSNGRASRMIGTLLAVLAILSAAIAFICGWNRFASKLR